MSVPALAHGAPEAPGGCMWPRGPRVPGCHKSDAARCPHQTSRRGPVQAQTAAGKQEDWSGVGTLLRPLSSQFCFVLRSSGPAGASALISLCRPSHQQRVSFFLAFLSHFDSAAFCFICNTLMSQITKSEDCDLLIEV